MTPEAASRDRREPLADAAADLYRALVSEHGHDSQGEAPWPACLPVHIAMNRYLDAASQPSPSAVPEPLAILDVIDGIVDDTHPEGDGCPLCVALDDLRESLEALPPSAPEDIEGLRAVLWSACPHETKYGDDGETQCHGADFKRDPLDRLVAHVSEALNDRALASSPVAPTEETPGLLEDEDGAPYPTGVQERVAALRAKAWWADAHGDVVLLSDATDAIELALAAFAASTPGIAALPALDEAWKAAEAALPDGWHGPMLTTKPGWPERKRWAARAYWTGHGANGAEGTGPTPAAALQDLASRLATTTEETT